ncbi:MAG: alpha/beta fold hydrolase [Burkholderiales bacterium]|nr:alpha/beta fold hydrolase [Burkholderiales bacterium]
MLARLLRNMILMQVLLGACLGYWLGRDSTWPALTALITAVVLPFFSMLLVDTYSALRSRGAEPMGKWWRALFGEYRAGFIVFLFRQPWSRQPPVVLPPITGTARVPVVLIHGYMCNQRIWDDISSALRQRGHTVVAVNLEPLFTSIDRYAPIVEAAVDELCRTTGAHQVALVGHSMGGLAIRAWIRLHGTGRVARAMTLGTPHQGTKIASHVHSTNGKQMVWKSRWLAALEASETDAIRALFRIALTPQDNIVFPQREQVMPGVVPQVFEGLGHVQLCLAPEVIQWVAQQLELLPHAGT